MIPQQPPQNVKKTAEREGAEKVLANYLVKLGLSIDYSELENKAGPVFTALDKTLKNVSANLPKDHIFAPGKIEMLTTGLLKLGKSLLTVNFDGVNKSIIGLTGSWGKHLDQVIKYGVISKNVAGANKELYDNMGLLGKLAVNLASAMNPQAVKKLQADAEKMKHPAEKLANAVEKAMNKANDSVEDLKKNLIECSDRIARIQNPNTPVMDIAASGEAGKLKDSLIGVAGASEAAEGGVAAFGTGVTVATGAVILVIGAIVALGYAFYKLAAAAISARMEMKKFDEVFGGVGETDLFKMRKQLIGINTSMLDLGMTTEKVNGVVLNYLKSGISYSRAMSDSLVRTTLELSGATGVATDEISGLFSQLIKTTQMTDGSIKTIGNSFVGINQLALKFGDIAASSFKDFSEGLTTSSNSLLIAAKNGKQFTDNMIKDISTLVSLTTTLGLSIGEINGKFEEAGNILSSQSSGFRDMLIIAKGANINDVMNDTFDKTSAMLKTAEFMQRLNTQFNGNINITSQVVAQQFGVSKETALRLLQLDDKQKAHIREMQKLMVNLDENAVSKSYKKVTATLVDAWEKVKASAMNAFERAVGGSNGLTRLQEVLTRLVEKFQNAINSPTGNSLVGGITKLLDNVADWASNIISNVEKFINWISGPKTFGEKLKDAIKFAFGHIIEILMAAAMPMGSLIAVGMMKAIAPYIGPKWATNMLGINDKNFDKQSSDLMAGFKSPDGGLGSGGNSAIPAALAAITKLYDRRIDDDKKKIDDLNSVGAKGDDLTYGRRHDGTIGFMTVAERQFDLQEDIKKAEEEKEKAEIKYREDHLAVARDTRDAIRSIEARMTNGGSLNGINKKNTSAPTPMTQPVYGFTDNDSARFIMTG